MSRRRCEIGRRSPRRLAGQCSRRGIPKTLRSDPEVRAALAVGALLASAPLIRETGRPAKANLSLDSGILAAIDEEAARRKLTRSGFVELMARHMLTEHV